MIVGSKEKIPQLLGIYTIPAAIVCLLATVGIRNRVPPTPPSNSALASSSEPFLAGVKLLVRNKPYMILLTCFGAGIGIFTSFSTLLQQILCVKGYSNDLAGLCGALFVVFGILGAFLLGLYVDRTKKFIEVTKISFCLAALASIAFAVVSQMRIQGIAVAVVSSLFGMFGFAIYPISMELAVECSYPIGEATSAGLIFISGQIQGIIFIMLFQLLTKKLADDPQYTCALSWKVPTLVMAAFCSAGACLFVIFFHTEYKRLKEEALATNSQAIEQNNGIDNEAEPELLQA
ncbi:solute carrier family 49 member A3-like isoform X2 [Acipenser ruthenus]|nr:solute carrier family 49 member A3-like isoform X2 [Acipenser ruthenus]